MTRVELEYTIEKPLDETNYEQLNKLASVYGLMGLKMKPDASGMTVEYDATRLNPAGVDRVLHLSGLPVKRIS